MSFGALSQRSLHSVSPNLASDFPGAAPTTTGAAGCRCCGAYGPVVWTAECCMLDNLWQHIYVRRLASEEALNLYEINYLLSPTLAIYISWEISSRSSSSFLFVEL